MEKELISAAVKARAAVTGLTLPGEMSTPDAYLWQDAYVAGIAKPVAGYKLAINGAAQMAHFGVTEGASARVFSDEVYADGVALPRSAFASVSVEPELCAVLNDTVDGLSSPVDHLHVMAAIDRFHPAIELIDQRGFLVPQLTLQQAMALNFFNAGVVLGAESIAPQDLDVASLRVTMDVDGATIGDATGAAPQPPVEAVQWLINHCLTRGVALEPGMLVMCGTHIPITTLEDHATRVDITMRGLGSVGFTLTD